MVTIINRFGMKLNRSGMKLSDYGKQGQNSIFTLIQITIENRW